MVMHHLRSPVVRVAGAALAVFGLILAGALLLRHDPSEDDDRRAQAEFRQRPTSPAAEAPVPAGQIGAQAFTQAVWNRTALIVDARDAAAYAQGHLPGAVSADNISDLLKRAKALKKSTPILVYGQNRQDLNPQRVVDTLAGLGVTQVAIAADGVEGWLKGHGPLTTTPAPVPGAKP